MTETHWLTAGQIGSAYAARRLSPVELVQALLNRISALDPQLNAFIRVDVEAALDAARDAEKNIVAGRARGPLRMSAPANGTGNSRRYRLPSYSPTMPPAQFEL